MKRDRQFNFVDLKISSIIPSNDPLKILFDSVDFSFIYSLVKDCYVNEGRKGYDPQALFKALLLIYLGFASSERDLAEKLSFDGRLAYLCGFSYGKTPKHNTFHYFRERLGEDIFNEILVNLIAQCLCLIKAKSLKLSVDSSHIEAFRSDDEAAWGYKSKDFSFFGYKVHIEVANTKLPIPTAAKVTAGNEWDGKFLPELTDESSAVITDKGKNINALLADAGYDSTGNASYLISSNITPFIAANPRARQNALHRGDITISPDGKFLCKAGIELCYWGKETLRKRIKFRCGLHAQGGSGCLFKNECYKSKYGPTFYLKEDYGVQDIMKAIRTRKSFKSVYKMRTVIERFFSILKGSHGLEDLRMKGIKNVSIHVFMSICAYLSRLIAGMKLKTGLLPV
jgi:transposase